MGSTFLSLHYHIIFATKNRARSIAPRWKARLHEYLGGTVRGLDGVPQAIGGVEDHVHLLVGLRATHILADFVRELKKSATTWVHEQKLDLQFAWQEGYAAFTVGPNARAGCQTIHHTSGRAPSGTELRRRVEVHARGRRCR